ncbi:hypothetical protein [Aeromonas caviae]|uniref:hypothetical protein n=1 Tax=Aeromonas caviae TaxID=648 RepID=UPI0038D02833
MSAVSNNEKINPINTAYIISLSKIKNRGMINNTPAKKTINFVYIHEFNLSHSLLYTKKLFIPTLGNVQKNVINDIRKNKSPYSGILSSRMRNKDVMNVIAAEASLELATEKMVLDIIISSSLI